jgi:hypothetical protein
MTTTQPRTTSITAAVGVAIAAVAAPALLFLAAGTAQAEGFNPQPDPPGVVDPGVRLQEPYLQEPYLQGDPGVRPPGVVEQHPVGSSSVGFIIINSYAMQ